MKSMQHTTPEPHISDSKVPLAVEQKFWRKSESKVTMLNTFDSRYEDFLGIGAGYECVKYKHWINHDCSGYIYNLVFAQ